MDFINIIAGILLPIAGWVIGRFFTLEKNDSKLAAAVDNLTISIAEVCDDVKNEGCKNV